MAPLSKDPAKPFLLHRIDLRSYRTARKRKTLASIATDTRVLTVEWMVTFN